MVDDNFSHEAQRAFVRSQLELVEIIDNASDAILTYDQDGLIILFNIKAENALKQSAANALGEDVGAFFPKRPWSDDAFFDNGRVSWRGLTSAKLGDGKVVEFCVSASSVVVEDRILTTLIIRGCDADCQRNEK